MAVRRVYEPASVGTRRQRMVFDTLSLLVPFDLLVERKVRIGKPGDGSYVIVDCLRTSQPVMSFWRWSFGKFRDGHGRARP